MFSRDVLSGCSLGMFSRDVLSGCSLGMFSRDVLSGCSLGMFSRDVLSGCSLGMFSRMFSRDVLSGCSLGMFSRDVLSGCSLGMFSRDVLSGCSLGMFSRDVVSFQTDSIYLFIEFNLQIVVEANYTALEIKEVFPEDAGTYVVIARNLGGEARTSGLLSIDGLAVNGSMSAKAPSKPYFTQQLQNKDVQEGSRAHFKCEVAGFPEPEVCHTIETEQTKHSIHNTNTSQNSIHTTDTFQAFNLHYRHIPNFQSTIQTHPKHSIHTTDTFQAFNLHYRRIPKLSIHNTDTSQHSTRFQMKLFISTDHLVPQ